MNQTEPQPGPSVQVSARILVVEDDVVVRAAAAQYLRDCGFTVVEAFNVDEAADLLQADPLIRAVFTDVKLPGLRSGVDLMGLVRAEYPHIHVMLATGVVPLPEPPTGVPLLKKPYYLFEGERHIKSLLARDTGVRR